MHDVFLSRQPHVNAIHRVREFMAAWSDATHPANAAAVTLKVSAHGNVNSTGVSGLYRAPDLTPHQRAFEEGLEPGVRALVLLCVHELGWITYSSCEGHRYADVEIEPVERQVGVLPRSDEERASIVSTLAEAVRRVGRVAVTDSVRVGLVREVLADPATGEEFPVVDILFARAERVDWDEYFAQLPDVYARFVQELHDLAAKAS